MSFVREVEITLAFYYGVTVSTGDVCMAIGPGKPHGEEEAVNYLKGTGLDYSRTGNVVRGAEFVVGRQLGAKFPFVRVELGDDLVMPGVSKLSQEDEVEVTRRLYAAGLVRLPRYFLFQCYRFNDLSNLRR